MISRVSCHTAVEVRLGVLLVYLVCAARGR